MFHSHSLMKGWPSIVKRAGIIGAALLLIAVVFFGVPCLYLTWMDLQRSKQLGAERERATDATSRMTDTGRFYAIVHGPNGTYNRLELAPRGKKVNDNNIHNLEGLTAVVGLDLSETKITDAGLASVKGLTDLEYLQLLRTDITDAGLENLVGLVKLEAVDLTGTRVTQAGAKYLERLPNLKVVCAAGTGLSQVKGVAVDHSRVTESWMGIKARREWSSKGWALVVSGCSGPILFQQGFERKGDK
jgi:hypothetical protein